VLIDAGADVNATAPAPSTKDAACGVWQFDVVSGLQLSASQGDEEIFFQLLRAGADPCRSFAIPVMSSLYTSDLSSTTFGDDVEAWQLVTPLIWAVKLRKVDVVKFLLSQKNQSVGIVDVNAVPILPSNQSYPAVSNSWTPLMWAIANVAEDVAAGTALVSDLSLSLPSSQNRSAALQIFDLILQFPGANPNAGSTCEAATPLSLAAALGLENVIQLLVDAGASIPETAALSEATVFAHAHCLQRLCQLTIERHLTTKSERLMFFESLVQCLGVAARSGLLECAQILTSNFSELVKHASSCEESDNLNSDWGKGLASALLYSCSNGQPHVTAFLQPLSLYSPSVLGFALRNACKNGDVSSCKLLISAGANGDWVDAQEQKLRSKGGSRTAISAAFKRWGRTSIAEYEACCSLLIETCSSSAVNVRDSHGNTPLKWAAIRGHHVLLRALLDKGADVFAEDSDGNTPICHAIMNGHSIIVCELVDREPQLYKVRIKIPSYFKVYESGLLPPTVPFPSRKLHLSMLETIFKPQTRKQVPLVLCVRHLQDLKSVESLNSILASCHSHERVVSIDPEADDAPYTKVHLNILKIRDIGSSCPRLPLPKYVCRGDVVSEVARIGMQVPIMRLIRCANTVGNGVSDIRSSDGDSLLLLCCGQNWRDEVTAIIESGCPVDCPSRNDPMMTAIVWAAHKGHAEIACDLINAGSQHVQRALLIATTRCHVTVVEAMCRLLALKPASQRPDMSCAILIAAAHGSASAISALSSICPVPQIIADLRCSCIKGTFTVFSQSESALTENSKQPAFFLIEGDPKSTQCFRWLLPGAFKALLQNQFEERAIQNQLEWESSDTTVMGFDFKNKLMHAHQNLTAVFGSEDWTHRMKLTRSAHMSSILSEPRDDCAGDTSIQDTATSDFPHEDAFFVSENIRPLVCINDDGLESILVRRKTIQSSFWSGATCSLQLQHQDWLGHSSISTNGRDLSDVTWMLLIPETTPLHMAAASGSSEALKTLLSLKNHHYIKKSIPSAALSAIDSSGLTPLCYAARFANTDMCALLLDEGADIKPWEHAIQQTISWLSNRRRWGSLLAALVSIHASTADVPLLPHSNQGSLLNPFKTLESDTLVCVPCVLWAALSGCEAKTRLLVEAGADAVNALAWIETVGFGYCQENSSMHKLAASTMSNSQDYTLMGPYSPAARPANEIDGIESIPSVESFPISSYKRHEVAPGHRVQVVAAILGWNDWSLRKLITFHDIPQDHYAVTASNSGKSQQLPGKPDLIQAVQLHVNEFICEAVVVIGVNYILGVRFTTNQRTLPWMGRNWGDDECKIQRVMRCSPQGREICGFFGLKSSSGHGRLLHLGFVARLRGSSDCMRRHRHEIISNTEEWTEPTKAYSMEESLKNDLKDNLKSKKGVTPRSNTPWTRSPLPGRTHSPFASPSQHSVLLNDFENDEKAGVETAMMNHVWTESPKQRGGSKSVFIASSSRDPTSPTSHQQLFRARTGKSISKTSQRSPTRVSDTSSTSLPDVNHSASTSPNHARAKLTQVKEVATKKDAM
jgi:ankyrin repeat protein